MSSTEDKAYEIMRELDVNYVLVIFGGLTGYSSDGELSLVFPCQRLEAKLKMPSWGTASKSKL